MYNNRYNGLGFFKSKSPYYENEDGSSTLYFTLLAPSGRNKETGKGRWKYVSFVAYNKLAQYLNDSVKQDDCISLVAEPITVRKKQAEGDDIFTQYLAVREFKNLSNLIEKYQSTSIHDLSDGHIDTDDELEVTNEKSSEDYEHGKTSMLDDDFEMDDDYHEPELGF